MKTKLIWQHIIACHNINKSIKKGETLTPEMLKLYYKKDCILKYVCKHIKNTEINYSYSFTYGSYIPFIIYFEYNGLQVSFHTKTSYALDVKDKISWDKTLKGWISIEGKYPGTKDLQDRSGIGPDNIKRGGKPRAPRKCLTK